MRSTALPVAVLVSCLLLAACGKPRAAQQDAAAQQTGAGAPAAPELVGVSSEGDGFSLRTLAGQSALLVFLRGAYCPLCLRRLRALAAYGAAYRAAGVRTVGVTLDSPALARATAQRLALPFPLVSTDTATFRRWGLWPEGALHPLPAEVVLDARGGVRYLHIGVTEADRQTDPALLGTLDSLRAAGALAPP